MPKAATPSAVPDEPDYGIATVNGRDIKMRRLLPDQLLVADMLARRMQRLVESRDGELKFEQADWEKFLNGTRRLLDWIGSQFVDEADLDWFEDQMLTQKLTLGDIGPLLNAMGLESKPAPENRKARRATKSTSAKP